MIVVLTWILPSLLAARLDSLMSIIFLMDPFNYEWRITFTIDGNMIRTNAKNMIAHFVPADGTRRNESVRNNLLSEFEVSSVHAI